MSAAAPRPPFVLALALALPLAVAACGKKADLRPPEGEVEAYTYPKQYPAPETVVPTDESRLERRLAPLAEPDPVGFRGPAGLPLSNPDRTTTRIHRSQ